MLLEFDKDVLSYEEQPLKINYELKAKNTRYTPDVLVTYKDGSQKIFEVKYQSDLDSDAKLQHKISVLKEDIPKQLSLPFKIFTDTHIDQTYLKNCIFLYKNDFLSENTIISTKILKNINKLSMTDEMRYVPFWYEKIVNTIIPRYVPHSTTITQEEVKYAEKYLNSIGKTVNQANLTKLLGCNFFSKDNTLKNFITPTKLYI